MIDAIARFRRFARAVTSEVGALDTSFLGRGRALGAARVLNAIGRGHSEIADIRRYLDLDSGLMSRLLRGLEDEDLVRTVAHPDDARRRTVLLTEAGRREFEAYEHISNARAEAMLSQHSQVEALLSAMDLVASALGRDRIAIVGVDPDSAEARYCLDEYYRELAVRFDGGFEVTRSRNPDAADIIPPRGAFLVASSDGLPIGCVGLKGNGSDIGEIKRLWVSPAARGLGIARQLMDAAEQAARRLSIATLRLDTNLALPEASRLYERLGWHRIDRFNDDPYADIFFAKEL